MRRPLRIHLALCSTLWLLAASGLVAYAQAEVLLISKATDSLAVDGQLELDAATYEARVLFTQEVNGQGMLFNEWANAVEDKQFLVGPSSIGAYSHPVSGGTLLESSLPLSLGVWHHVAYVYDGSEERLYLDGRAVTRRHASGNIGDSGGSPFIGSIFRDGERRSSMVGYVDYLRISSSARYSGDWFTPPTGNLSDAGGTTVLHYAFQAAPGGQIADESGNGHIASCAGGFATCPSVLDSRPGKTLGDLSGDGEVSALDVPLYETALFSRSRFEQDHPDLQLDIVADANGDGRFSVADGDFFSRWSGVNLPVPGDADNDRDVDLDDFGLLKKFFGSTDGTADFDRNGMVDLNDFGLLKSSFGFVSLIPPAAQVPEPSSRELALAGLFAALLGWCVRARGTVQRVLS